MGVSASSLLDDNKSHYIKGEAEVELKQFSPYYRKQFSVAQFSQVEDDLQQHKEKVTQLLKQREAPQEGEVLYEEVVLYFDDTRKWKDRYIVVRANYSLECHESLESFVKGAPAFHKLLPTGGTVLTTEEKYMAMVDKCFPDDSNVKEDFVPPLSGMPGQFPVYLRLPYRRDSYFCFKQQAKQEAFISILSDCIRHQNQDFLKRKTCEVQAFLKAIQLYRQDKGKYEDWNMLIGSDVRVMANVVMERLLPSLEKDMLPRLKAKKTEKKRVWFATVEAAYILAQEHLLEGLSALKEECRSTVRQQEVLIHSDMDQILSSRRQLEEKVRDKVSEPVKKLCAESVQPYLGSILEELMEPISSGFQEGRQLSEKMMDMCQDVLVGGDTEQLKKSLDAMMRPNLLSCYQKISSLQEKLQHLQDRFGFSNVAGVIHSAQIDLQQLMENAACTFEQLLVKAVQDNPDNASSATEKAKHRVLKQYDYDSSTVRKRIFQEALVSITLPFIKKNLAPTCKTDLQGLEQSVYADHSNFIHVENVYEQILLQSLDAEVTKVVKEAASLKKYNLFTDSRDLVSQSSRSSLSSPSVSIPGSPAMALASPSKLTFEPQPLSPLVSNGLSSSHQGEEQQQEKENSGLQSQASTAMTVTETPLGKVEETEPAECASLCHEKEIPAPKSEEIIQTVIAEPDTPVELDTPVLADTIALNETQEAMVAAEAVILERGTSVETEQAEVAAEAETPSADAPEEAGEALAETPAIAQSSQTDAEEAAEQTEDSGASAEPVNQPLTTSAAGTCSQPDSGTEEDRGCESPEAKLEAPSSGEAPALAPEAVGLDMTGNEAEQDGVSDANSLDVSVGSESPPSDVESTEDEVKVARSSAEDVSTTSDVLEEDPDVSRSPMSPDDTHEDTSTSNEPPPQTQTEAASGEDSVSGDIGAGASANAESADPPTLLSPEPATQDNASSPEARPPDCIKDIRDLVVEVIEVEELVQRYPSGVPKDD